MVDSVWSYYYLFAIIVSLKGIVGDHVFDERKDVEFCLGEGNNTILCY